MTGYEVYQIFDDLFAYIRQFSTPGAIFLTSALLKTLISLKNWIASMGLFIGISSGYVFEYA